MGTGARPADRHKHTNADKHTFRLQHTKQFDINRYTQHNWLQRHETAIGVRTYVYGDWRVVNEIRIGGRIESNQLTVIK